MGFWSVGGELGKTLGPIVIVNTVSYLTMRGTPVLMIGGWLTTVILFLKLRSIPGTPVRTKEKGEWWQVLRAMKKILVPVFGIIVASSFIDSALFLYLPTYLLEMGAEYWFAGASLSIFQAAGVFGAFSGGLLSDRYGRRFVLGLALLATPFFMFIFLRTSDWSQIGVVALMGITSLSIQPGIMALIYESFPDNRAYANGVYMALSFGINASSALLIGIMGDLFGLKQAYISSAIIMLFGLPLIFLLPSRKNPT
jgi:FSR family fosmidomycin resistance protein-like MFS transporter